MVNGISYVNHVGFKYEYLLHKRQVVRVMIAHESVSLKSDINFTSVSLDIAIEIKVNYKSRVVKNKRKCKKRRKEFGVGRAGQGGCGE